MGNNNVDKKRLVPGKYLYLVQVAYLSVNPVALRKAAEVF
jgi:hypothetical protein